MSTISYILEVHEPKDEKTCICMHFADTVFPVISKGEILEFSNLGQRVRAAEIMHRIWLNDDRLSFQTVISTEEISS